MKKALILGCSGQDGTYLFKNLKQKKYEIIGIDINSITSTLPKSINPIDISNTKQVNNLLNDFKPDEIYYLAAYHRSSEDKKNDDIILFKKSIDVNVLSLINFLDGINKYSK